MNITFYGETRKNFNDSSNESAVPALGNFKIKELLLTEKWQEKSIATVSFNAPNAWLQNNLFPGRNPSRAEIPYRRARYFNFRKNDNSLVTFVLTNFEAEDLGNETSDIKVEGADPRIFFEIMSSSPYASGESMISTRFNIASLLTAKVSNVSVDGMEAWQKLPLSRLNSNYSPTTEERRIGISTTSESFSGGNIEVAYPDPLPVKEAVDDLYGEMPQVELYPIDKFGNDGTNSPWWAWVPRVKTMTSLFFSENGGDMKINKYSGTWLETETMAYSSNDNQKFSFASGKSASRAGLRGPWAGIKTESFTPPENVNVNNFLRTKATTGTMQNSRLVIDCTLNFDKKDVKPFCGMIVNVRVGENIYYADVTELISHYSNEKGWEINSPIFVDMDSVDLTDPIDSEKAIIFTLSGDTKYIIPTRSITNDYYNWRIFVDGKVYGVFSGSSSTTGGINISVFDTSEKVITLIPADGVYRAGWGRAWSRGTSITGLSVSDLKSVINDPDWAHIASEDDAGDGFRAHQFRNCWSLKSPIPESMPNTVKKIGDDAFAYQYIGCSILEYASTEFISELTEEAGDRFRAGQYSGCKKITSSATEYEAPNLKKVGASFRASQYSGCTSITSLSPEFQNSNIETAGDFFRNGQYSGCTKLVNPATEQSLSLDSVERGFRGSQYLGCTSLIKAAIEKNPTSSGIYKDSFRASQYSGCTSLETASPEALGSVSAPLGYGFRKEQYKDCREILVAPDEVFSGSVIEIGYGFREGQYSYCYKLTTPGKEAFSTSVKNISPLYNSNGYFRRLQYSSCTSLTSNAEEANYSNLETIGDNFRNYQYSGCTSLFYIHPESPMTNLKSSGDDFRTYQYSNIGQAIAPDEGEMPALIDIGGQFRGYQYSGAKIIEIGKECDLPSAQVGMGYNFRIYQYRNCINITNSKLLSEGAAPNISPNRGFRLGQFMGSGIVNPLKDYAYGGGSFYSSYKNSQYENCYNLTDIPVETVVHFEPNFCKRRFANCINLSVAGANRLIKYTGTGNNTSFRSEMFAGTPLKNTSGNRINYIDGSEVIEGEYKIPSDFYTD